MESSLYFHIPFCLRRCGYCDFNTYAGMESHIPAYVKAICCEVENVLSQVHDSLKVTTIFFGGGTPSLVTPDQYRSIFQTIQQHATLSTDAEITLEANSETVTLESILAYKEAGFTRVSLGMQSASPFDLKVLDRRHKNESLLAALHACRKAGFDHINLDLIFGIPGQSLESWKRTLELALTLSVDHFSIYSLILEEGTRLKFWSDRGIISEPDDDLAADMYEYAMAYLENNGYSQYEISNWAKHPSARSQHNLQYWRYLPYLGFGAGAHGFWGNMRMVNTPAIPAYLNQLKLMTTPGFPASPAANEITRLSKWEMMQENLMVALRMTDEGLSFQAFRNRYGVDVHDVFACQIRRLTYEGLLEESNGERLRLTRKGRLFGNRVFAAFIANKVPVGYEYLDDQ